MRPEPNLAPLPLAMQAVTSSSDAAVCPGAIAGKLQSCIKSEQPHAETLLAKLSLHGHAFMNTESAPYWNTHLFKT